MTPPNGPVLKVERMIKGIVFGCLLWLSLLPGAIPQQVLNEEPAPNPGSLFDPPLDTSPPSAQDGGPALGTVWLNVGPHQRLGRSGSNPTRYEVDVPTAVVETAGAVLAGEPDAWTAFRVQSYARQPREIVWLHDSSLRSFICLVEPGRWVRLNDPRSLSVINEIMRPSLTLPGDLKEAEKLAAYLRDFVGLYQGNCRFVLSGSFWRKLQGHPGAWLQGTEEKPEVLQALCIDPAINGPEDSLIIRCNFLNYRGAVEQWTFNARASRALEVTRIAVEVIRPNGTFSIGLVGS